jgi:hypothetical protein
MAPYRAVKSKDKRDWNGYRFFRHEVKKEIRVAEKEYLYVRNEINSNYGNSRSLWKTINDCSPRKSRLPAQHNSSHELADNFNEYFTSLGRSTAIKVCQIATEHNLEIIYEQRTENPPEIFFTVYVNDLPSTVVNCKPECYVNDSKLYTSFLVNNFDLAIDQINKDLDQLCCWCCGNSLLVNPEKTKVLVLGILGSVCNNLRSGL